MYIIRNVFRTKPGEAKDLVAKFKAAHPHLGELGIRNSRVLTDVAAPFWTVVVESEVDDLQDYFDAFPKRAGSAKIQKAMKGYMDLVAEGYREIWRIE